jgi:type I restriction enzyme, R subunit
LLRLRDKELRKEAYAKSIGLKNAGELAFFGLFNEYRKPLFHDSEQEQVAFTKEIVQIIRDKQVIDWTEKEDIKREMRSLMKRKLKAKGCPRKDIEPLIYGIMNLASIRMKDG